MAREKILSLKDIELVLGTKEVLKGINLDVFQGDIIGYIGQMEQGRVLLLNYCSDLLKTIKAKHQCLVRI